MLSLEELKTKVMDEADKAKQLATERAEQKSKVCDIIRKNFETFILPFVKEMNLFMEQIRCKVNGSPSMHGDADLNIPLGEGIPECYSLSLRTNEYGVHVEMTNHGSGYFSQYLDGRDFESNICRYQYHFHLRNIFLTEDKTLELLEKIKGQYVAILNTWATYLEKSNADYAKAIEDLKNMLSSAHAVETKEDGTVEIMLGGKKYVGRVAEE